MLHTIYKYRKICAKIEYHKTMVNLLIQETIRTPCTDTVTKQRLYQAKYYHSKRIVALEAEAHGILDSKVVRTDA